VNLRLLCNSAVLRAASPTDLSSGRSLKLPLTARRICVFRFAALRRTFLGQRVGFGLPGRPESSNSIRIAAGFLSPFSNTMHVTTGLAESLGSAVACRLCAEFQTSEPLLAYARRGPGTAVRWRMPVVEWRGARCAENLPLTRATDFLVDATWRRRCAGIHWKGAGTDLAGRGGTRAGVNFRPRNSRADASGFESRMSLPWGDSNQKGTSAWTHFFGDRQARGQEPSRRASGVVRA